ncbi:MAG: type IV pilus secretin PilQ, partial [Myxococcota bacterium]
MAVDVVGRELQIVITDAPAPTAASEPAPPAPAAEPAPTAAPVTLTAAAAEAPAAPAPSRPAAPKRRAAEPTPSAAPPEALHRVENVRFEPKDGFYRLTVQLAGPASSLAVSRAGTEASPELRLSGAALPSALERTMDVTAVAGDALNSVSTYMDGSDLVVAASILDATEHRHWRKGQRLMWDFRSAKPRVLDYEQESAASFSSEAARTAGRLAPGRQRYTGRRISLDLKDADIQNVLRLLADVSKLNIVAADDVTGRITIKLRNVPWDQALDIILRAKQLDKTRNGNIIRVAPLSVLRKEEELRLARLQAQVQLEPLTVRLIPVSYAVASDVAPQVKALLTNRGDVNIDKRTNVLIVEDIADVLTKVERLVRTLDTQTPQVLIEARIVEARSNFSRELGIQWGGNASFTQNFGNQTGLSFPSNIRIAGGADDAQNQVTEGVLPNANYAVNLPAAVGAGGGGALGFVFGSLNGGTLVNLRVSAAETTVKVKIVSAPKVVTLDNKEAKILSGERVPITVITANGPTTRFIDANIELKVLPHVTQDGSILMQIKAKKNELSDRIDFLGVPGVLTKEAETQMIVRDGDT